LGGELIAALLSRRGKMATTPLQHPLSPATRSKPGGLTAGQPCPEEPVASPCPSLPCSGAWLPAAPPKALCNDARPPSALKACHAHPPSGWGRGRLGDTSMAARTPAWQCSHLLPPVCLARGRETPRESTACSDGTNPGPCCHRRRTEDI